VAGLALTPEDRESIEENPEGWGVIWGKEKLLWKTRTSKSTWTELLERGEKILLG